MTSTASPIISQDQALSLLEQIIQQSQAEGVFVSITAEDSALSRFSENQIIQNLNCTQVKVAITENRRTRQASLAVGYKAGSSRASIVRNEQTPQVCAIIYKVRSSFLNVNPELPVQAKS